MKEAITLFGITNLSEESEETLKKKYRQLMIKYHPDNSNSKQAEDMCTKISDSYKLLKGAISNINIEKLDKIVKLLISDSMLLDAYAGKMISINNKNIDKEELFKCETYIEFMCSIKTRSRDGYINEAIKNIIKPISIGGEYTLSCDYDIKSELGIVINNVVAVTVCNKTSFTLITSRYLSVSIKLKYGINVKVNIGIINSTNK